MAHEAIRAILHSDNSLRVQDRISDGGAWKDVIVAECSWFPTWSYRALDQGGLVLWTSDGVYPTKEADPDGLDAHAPGAKLDAGKPLAHLVLGDFSRALAAVVDVGTYGAAKYTDHGWLHVKNGQDRYANAAMRHYLDRCKGEVVDEGSGLLHLAHQAWNLLAELELTLRNAEGYSTAADCPADTSKA